MRVAIALAVVSCGLVWLWLDFVELRGALRGMLGAMKATLLLLESWMSRAEQRLKAVENLHQKERHRDDQLA